MEFLFLFHRVHSIPIPEVHKNSRFKMLHLNHCKASPCVFNFSFLLFDHSFVTGVLTKAKHGGSSKI